MAGPADRIKDVLPAAARRRWLALKRAALASGRVRPLALDALDAADWVLGRRGPLDPPRKLLHGTGAAPEVGDTFLNYFRDLAGLRPTDAVLDVGCGVGRMAVPLTRYLTPPGRYEGFDVIRANAAWCATHITPRFPHFRFRHADVWSREYNPRAATKASDYRFPYPDRSFDFALLTSVFTHLVPADAAHYVHELGRVLRPGGRCLATFFLLNAESEALIDQGRALVPFVPLPGVGRVGDPAVPEACVALDESTIRAACDRAGLALDPPRYGSWCGRGVWFEFQDVVVMRKA